MFSTVSAQFLNGPTTVTGTNATASVGGAATFNGPGFQQHLHDIRIQHNQHDWTTADRRL